MTASADDVFLLNRIFPNLRKVALGDLVNIQVYLSSAGAGGAATEAMTVTGLAAADTILSISQRTPGANNLPLLGNQTHVDGAVTCIWSANPGAGAVVRVVVLKAAST